MEDKQASNVMKCVYKGMLFMEKKERATYGEETR